MHIPFRSRVKLLYYSFFKKGIPFNRCENNAPFFIVGSGRCGTTLLRRNLTAKEGIHIPPENWAIGYIYSSFETLRLFSRWSTIVDFVVAAHCQDTQDWFESYPNSFVEEQRKCPKKLRSLNYLLDNLYRYHAEISGEECRRWGDKTPLNVNYMDSILRVFPDAKFINMLRDGVDVVYSWNKCKKDRDSIEKPAKRWLSATTTANEFEKKHSDKILEVKYENLVKVPSKQMEEIGNFLNLSFDDSLLKVRDSHVPDDLRKYNHYKNTLEPISDKSVGKGRRNLTVEQRQLLGKYINKQLISLGYETIS